MTVDLDVIIVSHGDQRWLEPCLESLEAARGDCAFRTTVVENGGSPVELCETSGRRVLYVENRGFAAANNEGADGCSANGLLFLNPDTELVEGTLERLVETLHGRPDVGLVAVRQVSSTGRLWPSLHRFPSLRRAVAGVLAVERWPGPAKRLGERELDLRRYAERGRFDWTTGAALLVRRDAFFEVRGFDERFFLFSEETDLCKRIQDRGWHALVEPGVTFVHHAGKAGVDPRREAQVAYARLQYARKHFGRVRSLAYHALLVGHHALRLTVLRRRGPTRSSSAEASALALRVLLDRAPPPFRVAQD